MKYALRDGVSRIGRSPENDVAIAGPEAGVVSAHHFEIAPNGDGWRLRDCGSTNGTYVNGERVSEALLRPGDTIRMGANGPAFVFSADGAAANGLERTIEIQQQGRRDLLHRAVERIARRTHRRWVRAAAGLAAALLLVAGYAGWRIHRVERERSALHAQLNELYTQLAAAGEDSPEIERIAGRIEEIETRAVSLGRLQPAPDPLEREIRALMAEFGSEVYSIPPEFLQQVRKHVERYRTSDRAHIERAMGKSQGEIVAIQAILREHRLPPDLAYLVLVESALDRGGVSGDGAAGLWQFTPATARAYGLRVDGEVDERLHTRAATLAAAKYMRELILDFGSGSSVMLALAAWNSGSARVRQAIRRVRDPIRQRNFWHLYRVRALPLETREFVPRVFAAMIAGRNPALLT